MVKTLHKFGNSKGFVLTRTMLEHLGVEDAVDVQLEAGKIVLTLPAKDAVIPRPRKRQSFEEAADATFAQYGPALKRLAGDE